MGLIDDASLAFTAALGASKPGTAYSLKPTDGSGDFAFTRADDPNDGGLDLAATFINQQGYIEKGYENFLRQSNNFDTNYWTMSGQMLTPIGGQSGYDGTTDAWKIQRSDATAQNIKQNISQSGVQTFSVYAKAGNVDYISVISVGGATTKAIFSLPSDGSGTNTLLDSDNIAASIEYISDGWYRVSTAFDEPITDIRIYPSETATIEGGVITDAFIYIQDAMLNEGLAAMPYIESGVSKAQKGLVQDEPRFTFSNGKRSLLLEPERTNLFADSEYFGSWILFRDSLIPNSTTSPEGILNAYRFEETATTGEHTIRSAFPMTAGLNYVASVFVKAGELTSITLLSSIPARWSAPTTTFSLSPTGSVISGSGKIEPVGNDWYRCSINGPCILTSASTGLEIRTTNGAGAAGYGLYIYGAQVEEGSYPSSYIPTYGTTKTRFKDVCDRGSSLAYTGAYTLFMEFELTKDAVYFLSNTSLAYRLFLEADDAYFKFGSSNVFFQGMFDWSAALGTNIKMLIYKNGTDAAMFVNGTKYTPSANTLTTGNEVLDWRYINYTTTADRQEQAYIKKLVEFQTALSEDECIELTTL